MKKSIPLIFALLNMLVCFPVSAHPGGHFYGPPITKEEVQIKGAEVLQRAVSSGKLEKTWSTIQLSEPEAKEVRGIRVWLLHGKNPKAKEKKLENIYLYLSVSGEVMGASFKPLD